MDQTTIQIWGVIGTWVASIGTVSAVVTSLWLAYHQRKVKLKIYAGHRLAITPGSKSQPEYCAINIVNTSDRPANITNIGWECGRFKNKNNFLQIFNGHDTDTIPKTLQEGQQANYMIPFYLNNDNQDWVVRFPKSLVSDSGNVNIIKTLKVVVSTSIGQTFKVKVETGLINKLIESYNANK